MLDALGATLQQVVLAEHLHCDNLLRAGVPRHHHAPELALAQDTAEGKVLDAGLPGVVRHISAEPLFFWPFDPRPRTPKVKLFVLARGKSRCAIPTVRCEITEQISAHQSMHLPDDAFFGDERIGKSMTYHVDLQQRSPEVVFLSGSIVAIKLGSQ
jgi:hypothetical protein